MKVNYVIDFVEFFVVMIIMGIPVLCVKRLESVHCGSGSCTQF